MAPTARTDDSRRITLVTDELRGYVRGGGIGTATTFLALAVARMGHQVNVLYAGTTPTVAIDPEWTGLYERAGVSIRTLDRSGGTVEPSYFGRLRDVGLALRADPPDVVITQDLGGLAYVPLRLRHLGLDFERTVFVIRCDGTRRWLSQVDRKVRMLPGALAVTMLEEASLELADVVVSPSAFLVEWMRQQRWRLPEATCVIPHLTRASATGEARSPNMATDQDGPVEKLVFFGRLDERKGLRPFAAGLNALGPELLGKIELEFLGAPTPKWTPNRVEALLSNTTRQAVRAITFETELDQQEALARLEQPGTLAIMPSVEDNSPNTVHECLERGIPFIASDAGGTRELIAQDERDRVLFTPTAKGVEDVLRRALSSRALPRPARPAFHEAASYEQWVEVLTTKPRERVRVHERAAVDVIVACQNSPETLPRCLSALSRQGYRDFQVIVLAEEDGSEVTTPETLDARVVVGSGGVSDEAIRKAGLEAGCSPWVLFLESDDVPEPDFLETLVRAQAASGADVVSCGLYLETGVAARTLRLFLGEPRGLGVLSNSYGNVALIRRSLLGDLTTPWPVEGDADWPLLARLSLEGAIIVSVPRPLLTRTTPPGTVARHPSDALLVVEQFERGLPDPFQSLARLAAGLAADSHHSAPVSQDGVARRAARLVQKEGLSGLIRRVRRRSAQSPGGSRS